MDTPTKLPLQFVTQAWRDLSSLFFPHLCAGCGNDAIARDRAICHRCLARMPETGFFLQPENPVERLFWGRIPVTAAGSLYYFNGGTAIQRALHNLKYRGYRTAGYALGRLLGAALRSNPDCSRSDAIVPMPLFPHRERERGYNQAGLIAEGVAEMTGIPVAAEMVRRRRPTQTQTRKSRMERWENVSEGFAVEDPRRTEGRRLLLVDDVVTTGASLEACGAALLAAGAAALCIATVAYAEQ